NVYRIEKDRLWSFNSYLLILHRLVKGKNPLGVELNWVNFWVLAHDMSHSFMSKIVAKHLGKFIGTFLNYDVITPQVRNKKAMCIRVRLDVRHGKIFCPLQATTPKHEIVFRWDISLHALSQRASMWKSKWLIEDREGRGINFRNSTINANGIKGDGIKACRPKGRHRLELSGHCSNVNYDKEMSLVKGEDTPIHHSEGSKRPHTKLNEVEDRDSNVSKEIMGVDTIFCENGIDLDFENENEYG
ncbi:hypothetical protein Godav_027934, partial [Gossypium davidsonii]|nr:hypothetical protein [Gossypium davidsonii]